MCLPMWAQILTIREGLMQRIEAAVKELAAACGFVKSGSDFVEFLFQAVDDTLDQMGTDTNADGIGMLATTLSAFSGQPAQT